MASSTWSGERPRRRIGTPCRWRVEDVADRSPFDAEPVTEFVHRRAGLVLGEQQLDLIGTELPGAARAVALDRRRLGCIEAGKLLAELFQGPDLVFYVRVRSPNLHSRVVIRTLACVNALE